jgi:hypothetical protein
MGPETEARAAVLPVAGDCQLLAEVCTRICSPKANLAVPSTRERFSNEI